MHQGVEPVLALVGIESAEADLAGVLADVHLSEHRFPRSLLFDAYL